MSRRCGSLDPGIVLYLMEEKGMTAAAISDLLYQSSGLLGVSGFSDDMKTLLATDNAHAAEAVDLFVYRVCRELGSLAAALGGFDALVFTAGIGEHAPEIRRRVCEKAGWLGLEIDEAANAAGGPRITKGHSKTSAWMIRTDEDSHDRAPHLAHRWRKQKTQRLTDKLAPRAGGAASMMQNQVTGKAPIAVPVPTDTTGLTEVEALTFKNDHQNGAGNRLTLNERG